MNGPPTTTSSELFIRDQGSWSLLKWRGGEEEKVSEISIISRSNAKEVGLYDFTEGIRKE